MNKYIFLLFACRYGAAGDVVAVSMDDYNAAVKAGMAREATAAEINAEQVASGIPDAAIATAKIADNAVTTEKIINGAVTAAKTATAVQTSLGKADTAYQKAGSGIPKIDLATAVQSSLNSADSAYQKPGTGIPSTDMAAAVVTSLGKADAALPAAKLIGAQITLGGANPTQVTFQGANTAATLLGTNDAPFSITSGQTFVVNPDAAGDVTATFTAAAGTSTSDATPATDLSASSDVKLMLSVNGGAAQEVTFDWTAGGGCDSGTKIAAEMQTKIQALGGAYAAVTVDYNVTTAGKYVIKSSILGTSGAVAVTDSAATNCADDLKLGVANGGTEAAGTGDALNIAATTAAEVATKLAALAGLTATAVGNKVRITSDTTGAASSLAVNAGCALDAVFGITGTAYGTVGLGQSADQADVNYRVSGSWVKDSAAVTDAWNVGNKATTGFRIYCETAASTNALDLLIYHA